MFKIYIGSNKQHGLTKIGITKKDPKDRMKDYIKRNKLPTEGWGRTLSLKLKTEKVTEARRVEREAHQRLVKLGRRAPRPGNRGAKEVFNASGRGSWFMLIDVAKRSGLYAKALR